MQQKKMLFVVNPKAGKAQIKNRIMQILDLFAKAGYEVTVHVTQSREDAMRRIRDREEEYDLLVCSGGDGTLNEVVSGMVKSGNALPIGYIPAGSTNDFANSLRIPKNMLKAAQVVVEGERFACDIGSFNRDIFVYVAAFGIFTDVSYGTDQEIKNLLGHTAYVLQGVKSLAAIQAYPMRVMYDDNVIEGDFLYGMITNSVSVGGFKGITGKNVELNDGKLEVTLIRQPSNLAELTSIAGALTDRNAENEFIYRFKTSRLQIEADEPVAWTLDGEFGGSHKEVMIEDHKEAITILVPKKL